MNKAIPFFKHGAMHVLIMFLLYLAMPASGQPASRINDIRIDRFFGGPLAVTGTGYVVSGELAYIGSGALVSLYMHYQVNEGNVHTTHFPDIGINPQIPFHFVPDEDWVPEHTGMHQVRIWFTGLNGAPVGEGASDTLQIAVDVYDHLPQRELSLLESFSSIHCGSCAIMNPRVREMVESNSDAYTMVFYHPVAHENSPLYHYNPKDQDIRRQRYGVGYTPYAVVGSLYQGGTERVDEGMMDLERDKHAGFVISGSYEISENNLIIGIETESYASFADRRIHLYVVLTEDVVEFDEAPGSNGERIFYHVMRSFVPDAQGMPLDHQEPGSLFAKELTYELDPEALDYAKLRVVAFVQDTASGDVFQTVRLDKENGDNDNGDDNDETSVDGGPNPGAFRVYPNPSAGMVHIASESSEVVTSIRVFDMGGRAVLSLPPGGPVENGFTVDLRNLPGGMYILQLDTPNGQVHKNILLQQH